MTDIRARITKALIERTNEFRQNTEASQGLMEKVAETCLNFGCQSDNIRRLVEMITGESLPDARSRRKHDADPRYKYGMVFRVTGNEASHNYHIGSLVMVQHTARERLMELCPNNTWDFGNTVLPEDLTPATDAEIERFVKFMSDEDLTRRFILV